MKSIAIIIPVYNAFDVTLDCVQSVLRTIPRGVSVCVIDDASPSGDLREHLPSDVLRHPRLRVLRNEKNLGFVGTCNRGMLLESSGDVILLNSDTLVTKGWVQKLYRAAYSRPRIGTVTPLTNNGTICSVPRFLENNSLPDGLTLEEFSRVVEQVSTREYVEAPTCVGFCTYVRREMLDEVGVFDPIFKQGYGEENDLSLRGKAKGFSNIIDDATYIYHRGNMSFKEMREALSKANTEILNQRYPTYEQSVARFCSENPLAVAHDRIWNVLLPRWLGSKKQAVLHILHNGPFVERRHGLGGTEGHVQSLIRRDASSAHYSITPGDGCLYFSAHTSEGERSLVLPQSLLSSLLDRKFFDVVHLHHSLGFDVQELAAALRNHGNYIVSVHDYHLICGRLWLVKPDHTVCDGQSCGGTCGDSATIANQRRATARRIFEGAQKIVVFSESTRDILARTVGTYSTVELQHHGIEPVERKPVPVPQAPGARSPIKVACLGTFVPHKGSTFITRCAAEISEVYGAPVEWHFLGRDAEDVPGLINQGPFTPMNLRDKLAEIGAHIALLVPQCQETYSITLDEVVWSGMPVLCSPYGALPERVEKWKVGYVGDNSISGVRGTLERIVKNWKSHQEVFARTHEAPIISVAEEVSRHASMYAALCGGSKVSPDALIRFLQPDLCSHSTYSPKMVVSRVKREVAWRIRYMLAEGEGAVG